MALRIPRVITNVHNNVGAGKKNADVNDLKRNVQRRPVLANTTNKPSLWSQNKSKEKPHDPPSKIPTYTSKKDNGTRPVTRSSLRNSKVEQESKSEGCKHTYKGDTCSACAEVERFSVIRKKYQYVVAGEAESDSHRLMLCSDYTDDLHQYMRLLEVQYPVRREYLSSQSEVKPKMRQILTHWMMQVADKFELLPETKYLSIAILDRYLQDNAVARKNLQLVGGTALLISCKYEEMLCPEINDFVFIADKAYTAHDVIRMELKMLRALQFSLGRPLPISFLRRLTKVLSNTPAHHTMAKYLLELSILDYNLMHYRPSQLAAAATHLTQRVLSGGKCVHWSDTMTYNSGYELEEVLPCVYRMAYLATAAESNKYLKFVYDRYANSKNEFISQHSNWSSDFIKELAAAYQGSEGTDSSSSCKSTT